MGQKYLEVVKRAFNASVAYRAEVALWLILDTVPFIVLMIVWQTVYAHQSILRGYTLTGILQYYFLVMIINALTTHHFENWRVQQIRDGKIDFYLTRPFGYLNELFWFSFGGKLFFALLSLSVSVFLFFAIQWWLPLTLPTLTTRSLLEFILLIGFGYLIEYLFAQAVVLAGFWFQYAEGLEHFKWIIITLFSGSMIPLTMMPPWLARITQLLPFKYMYFMPIAVAQQQAHLVATDYFYLGATLAVGWGLSRLLWRKALFQYSSAGG